MEDYINRREFVEKTDIIVDKLNELMALLNKNMVSQNKVSKNSDKNASIINGKTPARSPIGTIIKKHLISYFESNFSESNDIIDYITNLNRNNDGESVNFRTYVEIKNDIKQTSYNTNTGKSTNATYWVNELSRTEKEHIKLNLLNNNDDKSGNKANNNVSPQTPLIQAPLIQRPMSRSNVINRPVINDPNNKSDKSNNSGKEKPVELKKGIYIKNPLDVIAERKKFAAENRDIFENDDEDIDREEYDDEFENNDQ